MNGRHPYPQPAAHREPVGVPPAAARPGPPPADLRDPRDLRGLRELRRVRRSFAVPAAVAVIGGYLLLVLLSGVAPGLMAVPLLGHLTFGLTLALALFAALFLTAWRYDRHMRNRFDPLADEVRAQRDRPDARRGER